jgi:hypothetical protein
MRFYGDGWKVKEEKELGRKVKTRTLRKSKGCGTRKFKGFVARPGMFVRGIPIV